MTSNGITGNTQCKKSKIEKFIKKGYVKVREIGGNTKIVQVQEVSSV